MKGSFVIAAMFTIAACSGSDDLADPPTTTGTLVTTVTTAAPDAASTPTSVVPPTDDSATPTVADDATSTSSSVTSVPEPDTLPEIGIPGLDSDDAFCAAWSRFAGSFQVVAVSSAFGNESVDVSALEVVASPVVSDAFDRLAATWPDDIADELDAVTDDTLGPFARRSEAALRSLVDVADGPTISTIAAAWLDGLAARDPSTPEFSIDLPDELWALVDEAAADFEGQLVAFADDPSLATDVETPQTDAYLASTCPDQGTLSGQEVDVP